MGARGLSPRSRGAARQRGVAVRSAWISRGFFAVVAVVAVAAVLSGTACTRWGKPGPVPPTIAPLVSLYVDPAHGSDSTGNGSQTAPYKTLTKAMQVLGSAKVISTSGVTVFLASGAYVAANGEQFPIVVPKTVAIDGTGFGMGPNSGTYIDGFGQDTTFEQLVHAAANSAYATLEIAAGASVSLSDVYVGASKLTLPGPKAGYWSLDVLGTLDATTSSFGAGMVSSAPTVSGILVPGGVLTCSSCLVHGNYFGIGGLSVPAPTSSPYAATPSITLNTSAGDSTIAAKVADILTDGTIDVTATGERFEKGEYAFADSLHPVVVNLTARGAVDFGGGVAQSTGGNVFIGARTTEISIVRRFETVSALDDTWNPNQQGANRSGSYARKVTFKVGASGKNVEIRSDASGSTVVVGPAAVPTPTPTGYPSVSPSPTATAS